MTTQDKIETHGFLSSEVAQYTEEFKTEFEVAFNHCENLSRIATTQIFSLSVSDEHLHELQILGYWSRCLSACQGSIVLCERGMAVEAQVLLRSAYEFLFFAVALVNDPTVFERLADQDTRERVKQAKGIIQVRGSTLDVEQHEALIKLIGELSPTASQINVYDAAVIAKAEDMYQTIYRGQSLTASHGTNLTSTNHFFDEVEDGTVQPVFGPSPTSLKFTLGLIERCLSAGIDAIGNRFARMMNNLVFHNDT